MVESNEGKVRDAKKTIEELNMEVVEMRDETSNTKNDLEEARERMFHF